MPYWLKGGTIALTVPVVATLLVLVFELKDGSATDWLIIMLLFPFAFSAMWFGGTTTLLIGFAQQYALYFTIGSLFGWIYGKIKK